MEKRSTFALSKTKTIMKTSEFIRLLQQKGWVLKRHGSGHDIYYNPQKPKSQVSVPRHGSKEIPKGTVEAIKREAGI